MMSRMHIGSAILTTVLVLFFFVGWAQQVDRNQIIRELGEPRLYGEVYNTELPTHGSPFLFTEWAEGSIFLSSGEVARDKMLRYNGFMDELFWFNPDNNSSVILDKRAVSGFSIPDPLTGDSLNFRRLTLQLPYSTGQTEAFAEVLYEGDFSLFVHRRIEEDGKHVVFRNNRRVELPSLKHKPIYLIKLPGHGLVQITRMRKSFFYDLMPGMRDAMRQALSNHPSRLRNERVLIDAVRVLDGICREDSTD